MSHPLIGAITLRYVGCSAYFCTWATPARWQSLKATNSKRTRWGL